MQNRQKVLRLAYGGMLAALIFVATYFLKLPVPITQGYIHLGDAFILLGAALLGTPAVYAAAVGSMLADLLGGYTLYLIPTFLIKGAVAAVAVWAYVKPRPTALRIALLALAELWMAAGYFLVEWLVLRYGLATAAGALGPNLIQAFSSVALALFLISLFRRVKLFPKE